MVKSTGDKLVTVYAYPPKNRPYLEKQKFKGLTKIEAHEKYQELIKQGYINILC